MIMMVLMWIGLGLLIGLAASRFSRHVAGAFAMDITLGIVGAIFGGLAYSSLGFPQGTGFLWAGSLGAASGAVAVLAAYQTVFRPKGILA